MGGRLSASLTCLAAHIAQAAAEPAVAQPPVTEGKKDKKDKKKDKAAAEEPVKVPWVQGTG